MGVFSEIKPKNHARRNPFDLSCYSTYNTKCGMILPLKFWPTLPSSEYSLDLKALMRTQPLATAAFAGFSISYDVVWTPYNDHYSSANQFIAQRLNKQHTTQPDITQIPHFNLGFFVKNVLCLAVFDAISSECSYAERIQMYNNQQLRISIPRSLSCYFAEHAPGDSIPLGVIRTLDLLEYGNYLPMLKAYVTLVKEFLDGFVYDSDIDKNLPYIVRLWSYLSSNYIYDSDTGTYTMGQIADDDKDWYKPIEDLLEVMSNFLFSTLFSASAILPGSSYHTLWPVLCYNKAFWQFYRNEYYDIDYVTFEGCDSQVTKFENPYVTMFNMDDVSTALTITDGVWTTDFQRLLNMFAVKPHQYKKDLFTGLLPSTQYGSVSTVFTDSDFHTLVGNMHSGASKVLSRGDVYTDGSSGVKIASVSGGFTGVTSETYKFDPALAISVLDLRKADSLQRFKERMLRAGNKTKDIFEAHGWSAPLSEKAYDVHFLGTFDGRLDINVVASTNDSERVNLGQLAANGIGAIGGKPIHFKCSDFGTLMVVAYLTKDAVYDAYGVNKAHSMLEPFDFPYPELQNVSLSPVVGQQVDNYGTGAGGWTRNYQVLGYLPQNMQYKTQNDLVHGEFFAVNPLTPTIGYKDAPVPAGIFSNMVTPRLDITDPKTLSFFYIQKDCADNIFVENADNLQSSDQFFVNVRFDMKAVQPLDVIGLPI